VRFISPETLSALNFDLLILETSFFIVCSHALPSVSARWPRKESVGCSE